jgi:hypothetical protein
MERGLQFNFWRPETTSSDRKEPELAQTARDRQPSGAAVGWIFFASVMMTLIGIFHIFTGIGGIAEDDIYVKGANYIFQFDVTTWGWIHLLLGLVILFASFSLYKGSVWARTVGVIMALISAVAAFAWMPYYPIWGITIVAVAVSVIWALTAHGRDVVVDR